MDGGIVVGFTPEFTTIEFFVVTGCPCDLSSWEVWDCELQITLVNKYATPKIYHTFKTSLYINRVQIWAVLIHVLG